MIQEDLSKELFKRIASLNLSPKKDAVYSFKDTIKRLLLDNLGEIQFTFLSGKNFEAEIRVEDYSKAVFSDYYFGRQRIKEQQANLNTLINNNNQVAWTLVTAYYSSFFMATEISKLFGVYMTNFTNEDMLNIIRHSSNTIQPSFIDQETSNYGFQVKVSPSPYDGYVKLTFYKKSPKAHVEVWKNIYEIVNKVNTSVDDKIKPYCTLFLNICNEDNKSWHNPSKIRNDWNYTYATYYAEKGNSLGSVFAKNLKSSNSAMAWAGNRTLKPHEQNIVASISYIYHCLKEVIIRLDRRLGFTD